MIDLLINEVVGKLGVDSNAAKALTGKAFSIMKDQAGDDLFSKVSSSIPGVQDLIKQVDSGSGAVDASGGMLGKLAGVASSLMGSKVGGGLEMGALLTQLGIGGDQASTLFQTILKFIQTNVGKEVTDQLVSKIPLLKSYLG